MEEIMSEEKKNFENEKENQNISENEEIKTNAQNLPQGPQLVAASMPYRVSPSEVNAFGVLDDSSYLVIYEKVRTELLRALGYELRNMVQNEHVLMPVIEFATRHFQPVFLDDIIEVEATITFVQGNVIRFDYKVSRQNQVTSVGFTQHIFIDNQGNPVNYGDKIAQDLVAKGFSPMAMPAQGPQAGPGLPGVTPATPVMPGMPGVPQTSEDIQDISNIFPNLETPTQKVEPPKDEEEIKEKLKNFLRRKLTGDDKKDN
jgi:YbgC/YbaW family acyl-CoA thioester hydrolase